MKILAALFALPLVGCSLMNSLTVGTDGSGHAKTDLRQVGSFSAIRHDSVGDVDIRVGESQSVKVVADDNLLPLIRTKVENGTLVISTKGGFKPKTPIRYTVTVPALTGIELNGVGAIKATRLHGRTLRLKLNGVGDIDAGGAVDELSLELNGVGAAKLDHLTSRKAVVKSTGTGDTTLLATKSLNIDLSGVGDVRYAGNPKDVKVKKSGVGEVSKL